MDGEVDGTVLDVGESGAGQICHHVRRHTVDAADFLHLKAPGFDELRFVVRHGKWSEGHALLQYSHAGRVGGTTVGAVPAGTERSRVFHGVGMGQNTRRTRTIGEELRAELLCGDTEADSVLLDGDGRVAYDAVEAEAGYVQHILRLHQKLLAVAVGVGVRQVALGIPVHRHLIRLQRMDADHLIAASADDLTVGVAPQQQMRHHGLPQDKAGHFQIRLIV